MGQFLYIRCETNPEVGEVGEGNRNREANKEHTANHNTCNRKRGRTEACQEGEGKAIQRGTERG